MCEKRATLRCDVVTLWITSQHFQVKDSKNSKDSALKNIKASGWQAMELLDHKPNCSKNQTSPKRCHHSAASRHCEELCTTFPDALQVWCQALPNSQAVLAETSWTRIGLRFILKGHNLYCTYKYKYIYIPVYIYVYPVYIYAYHHNHTNSFASMLQRVWQQKKQQVLPKYVCCCKGSCCLAGQTCQTRSGPTWFPFEALTICFPAS